MALRSRLALALALVAATPTLAQESAVDEGYARALMKTIVEFGDARVPELEILRLSRTHGVSMAQVMEDLGVRPGAYADDPPRRVSPPRTRPPGLVLPPGVRPPRPVPRPPVRPAPEPVAPAGGGREFPRAKYEAALERTARKYAGKPLPAASLRWLVNTFYLPRAYLRRELAARARALGIPAPR